MKTLVGLCRRLGRWQFLGLSLVLLWAIGWLFPCGCLGVNFWQPNEIQVVELPAGCAIHALEDTWLDEGGRPVITNWNSSFGIYRVKKPPFPSATGVETYMESQIHYELREIPEVGLVINLVTPSPGFYRYVSPYPKPKQFALPLWRSTEEEAKKLYRVWRSEIKDYWRSSNAYIPSEGKEIPSTQFAKSEPLQPIPSVGAWNLNNGPAPALWYFQQASYPTFPYWNIRHWNYGVRGLVSSTHMLIPSVSLDELLPWTVQYRKFTEFQARSDFKYTQAIVFSVCGQNEWEVFVSAIHGQRYYVMPLKENGEKFILCDLKQMKTQDEPNKK